LQKLGLNHGKIHRHRAFHGEIIGHAPSFVRVPDPAELSQPLTKAARRV
jgi:hypothetical protein